MLSTVIRMPHWFPGASFKREGSKMIPHVNTAIDEPYAVVQAALVRFDISIPDKHDVFIAFGSGGRNSEGFCRRESDAVVEQQIHSGRYSIG